MSYSRYILFVLAVIIGAAMGIFYARVISPLELIDTSPETLRIDYKTDYVLMVAETYSVEQDPVMAAFRLGKLGDDRPVELISQALSFALDVGYAHEDLLLMRDLGEVMATWNPDLDLGGP